MWGLDVSKLFIENVELDGRIASSDIAEYTKNLKVKSLGH